MKPVFVNQFFCSRNPVNSEVIIEMKHNYVEHVISIDGEQAVATPSNKVEDVASLCLTFSDAVALRNALDKIIGDVYAPNK